MWKFQRRAIKHSYFNKNKGNFREELLNTLTSIKIRED